MDQDNKRKTEKQLDLFNDFEKARVFSCIAGAYIGKFDRNNPESPIEVLSEFMNSEEEAETALKLGSWKPPTLEPE